MKRRNAAALLRVLIGTVTCVGSSAPVWAAEIQVGNAEVLPGETAAITASLLNAPGESISAVSVEIRFDAERLGAPEPTCVIDPRIGPGTFTNKNLEWSLPAAGLLRAGVIGINQTTISSGRLFACDFSVGASAPGGELPLASSALAARPDGASASITAASGSIFVDPDPERDGHDYTGSGEACSGGQSTGCEDNCPFVANADQKDTDDNGIGDVCECGDIDGNGRLNTSDARLIQRCSVGQIDPSFCAGLCDVTGDDRCNTADARLVQRAAVGEISRNLLVCSQKSFNP
jgi:hypothetical protein